MGTGDHQSQLRGHAHRVGSAMSIRPCPKCQHDTPRLLEAASTDAAVNFYRCTRCGHVWNVSKYYPDGPIWDVTRDAPTSSK